MTGDSLTFGTAPYLQYLFDIWGRELQVKAFPGVTIPQALPWTQAEVAAPPMPPVAVVALGANDTEPLPQLMWWIEGMIDTLPPTEHIIWVNYYTLRYDDTAKDQVLDYVASLHPNVTVLDWASVISQHPEMFLADGVHYTPAGYALRALTIAAALPAVS
jgi:lysophospholipase L1-like esterase